MDVIERLRAVSTGDLSDGLLAAGLPARELAGIRPIEPIVRMVGRARTVVFRNDGGAEANRVDYLEHVRSGDVLVLDNGGRTDCSVWGGGRALGAIELGVVGVVIDGAYRDVEQHRQLGCPVFGRAATVVSGAASGVVPVAVNVIVRVGGVEISPDDWLVGDATGVVVVPPGRVEEVLVEAERKAGIHGV